MLSIFCFLILLSVFTQLLKKQIVKIMFYNSNLPISYTGMLKFKFTKIFKLIFIFNFIYTTSDGLLSFERTKKTIDATNDNIVFFFIDILFRFLKINRFTLLYFFSISKYIIKSYLGNFFSCYEIFIMYCIFTYSIYY